MVAHGAVQVKGGSDPPASNVFVMRGRVKKLDQSRARDISCSMTRAMTLFLGLLWGTIGMAETCPPHTVDEAEKANLMQLIQSAPSELIGADYAKQMWLYWADAPDDIAQEMLDLGMQRIRYADLSGAVRILDDLVAYCPDYAEGYNQRAFANYLRQDFEKALTDLDRAIALSPDHFAALSGRALTLIGMGRTELAQVSLRKAVRLNPWMSERALLTTPIETEL